MSQVSSTRKLVSASALMASGTLISRFLGLLRVILISFILGNGTRQADILSIATMVPNALYILFAGGALNTVLVPQIVRAIKNDPDGGEAYTNRIMTAFLLIVGAVAIAVTAAAPLVTRLYSSAEWRTPELASQYGSMVALTYLTLPQIFFYGAFFLMGQVLNARDKFGPMMWAPIANNVVSILVLSVYFVVYGTGTDTAAAFTRPQVLMLGLGSTTGIIIQTLVLLPFVRKVGFKLRPRFDLKGTGLGHTFSLMRWTIGYVAVNQVVLMIVNRLATSATADGAGAGANVYSNAHLVWILPHSLITVSLATAMLPNASRLAAAADHTGVARESIKTARLALVALVPAAVGFMTLATPIAGLLFGNGKGSSDADWIAWTLMAFAIGLIPFTVQFICLRTFYALEDTKTPFLLQLVIASTNAIAAVAGVYFLGSPPWVAPLLAAAYSLAYTVGVFLSWRRLHKKLPALKGSIVAMHIIRLLIAAFGGGVAGFFASEAILDAMGPSFLGNLVAILVGLLVLGIIYFAIASLLRVREVVNLADMVRVRLGGKPRPPAAIDEVEDTETSKITPLVMEQAIASTAAPSLAEDLMPTQITPAITAEINREADQSVPASTGSVFEDDEDTDPVRPSRAAEAWTVPDGDVEPAIGAGDETTAEPSLAHSMPDLYRAEQPSASYQNPDLAQPGDLLGTRFRLEEKLEARAGIETWRAHDLVLSRDVVAHLLARGDDRIEAVLAAARSRAVVTDSVFLRVLDAVTETDLSSQLGGYVVCEYVDGERLDSLLIAGPLSALEAGWLVRTLAEAVALMHSRGMFHGQISPNNVIVTPTGTVRLVCFDIGTALQAATGRDFNWQAEEAEDVSGLGKLLYATLVQRWPGGPAWGLEAPPIVAGEPASPIEVRAGVSPALDQICVATLAPRDLPVSQRISTAAQLAAALSKVLGTADASNDLETRVKRIRRHEPVPQRSASDFQAPRSRPVAVPPPSASRVPPSAATPNEPEGRTQPRRGRPVLWLIVCLAVVALVVSLVIVGSINARENTTGSTAPGASTSADGSESAGGEAGAGTIEVVSATDFDPEGDGGNAEENPDTTGNAIDGDPATTWATLRYHNNPELGGLKPGVGLVLDLGEQREVTEVLVQFTEPGSSVELRIPSDAATGEAPMGSESEWQVVAEASDTSAEATLTPASPVTTQFLLVYLTSLPEIETDRYLTEVSEITVAGT